VNTPEEAEQIIKEIRGGTEFAKMAREKSVDEYSAANGGDMGWVEERDPHVPYVILDAAAELEVGEISGPIPLGATYAVIKLQARKEVQRVADSAARERIRKELALQKAPPLNDLVRQLRVKWNAQVLHPALTTGKTGLES
jgi:foldase protein PrsA